jgi:hypothetical protein
LSHSTEKTSLNKLASKVRSMFPGVTVTSQGPRNLTLTFPVATSPDIEVSAHDVGHGLYSIETSLILRPRSLKSIREQEFLRFLADENGGLRGVTILSHGTPQSRALRIKSSFMSGKGRELDEVENLGIDVLSLLRFAQILDERVSHSSSAGLFCYETYRRKYSVQRRVGNRYINFARHVFRGSAERVFAQITDTLKVQQGYSMRKSTKLMASLSPDSSEHEMLVRVPEDAPILTCFMPLELTARSDEKLFRSLSELNLQVKSGHFELSPDYKQVSFTSWKHLTNDLHQDSIMHMVAAMKQAEIALQSERHFSVRKHIKSEDVVAVTSKRAS